MWVLIWVTPVVFAAAVVYLALEALYYQSAYEETTGTVVRVYEWESENFLDEGPKIYSPVFRYTWTDGKPTEASTGNSSSLWNFPIGSEHKIRFDPNQKNDVKLIGPSEWLVARVIGILTIITAALALLGTFILRAWIRRGKPSTSEEPA